MRTWDIAKLLMERCNSPEDVERVIVSLKDPAAMQEVCSMLAAFSNNKSAVSHADFNVSMMGKGRSAPSFKVGQSSIGKDTGVLLDTSKISTIDQLESLFRSAGMTNKQVEQWVCDNFHASVTVGKGSLRRYLTKLLDNADLGLINRILSAAQRVMRDGSSATSDIKSYWDEFDKRYTFVE